ncbi:MAG: replication initiation factor domain-containing protein [Sulfuritalea sp.]|nr:replication initiation factor domain-containing protein [Sulfuritalea sp.]
MQTQYHHEDGDAGAPARSEARARTDAPPTPASGAPCSNTGRKNERENPIASPETPDWRSRVGRVIEIDGVDVSDTSRGGERLEMVTTGKHSIHRLHPLPDESKPASAALIDWLAFTLTPPLQIGLMARLDGLDDAGYRWMCGELVRLFNVDANSIERQKTGGSGYKHRARFPGGQILWGGANQRGTINVSITGVGCLRIENWPTIAAWLEGQGATLKRVDLAYDDFACETFSIEKLREWYEAGEFGAGGRKPEAQLIDDLGSGKGRTFYVGNRKNGKLCRGYEKGKQLGDPESPWVRVEVEWHDRSRVLPYDMLTRPGQYLAGAYPCLRFLNIEQSKIKTIFRGAKIAYDRAVANLRQQGGKLVNLMLFVLGGDYGEVVEALRRDEGYPKRIEPFSYHVAQEPEALAHSFGIMPEYAN